VVVGLLLTTESAVQIDLTPELILALFVPPLVFEAAFHLSFRELQHKLPAILILAVPGVILTTSIVGGILSFDIQLSLHSAGPGADFFLKGC
jgi:CPA1 family monovalent cation:H+ antiporter